MPLRYPTPYTWLVFLGAMDVMLTWVVLHRGGTEVNGLARWVIQNFGLGGMVAYKFALIVLIILIGEAIAKRREPTAKRFVEWSVAITAIPVVISLTLLGVKRLTTGAV
ncbi:MAG: DUF5658 family protein [Phycisphaerae bacterium]|nr:DUF5658 family protein [Tepidisphaeraceae bacterium]